MSDDLGTPTKTVYHLEMTSRDQFQPISTTTNSLNIMRVTRPTPELNWFLHELVGQPYRWGGRTQWREAEWRSYVDRDELETWVAYLDGAPVGYYELEHQSGRQIQILRLGLVHRVIGLGFGKEILTSAVTRCWDAGANKVLLNTCSQDHPHALPNYLARGFQLIDQTTMPANANRESSFFGYPGSNR